MPALRDEIVAEVSADRAGVTVARLLAEVQLPGEHLRCVVTVNGKTVGPRRRVREGDTVIFWPIDRDLIRVDYIVADPSAPDEYPAGWPTGSEFLQGLRMALMIMLGICLVAFVACLVMAPF